MHSHLAQICLKYSAASREGSREPESPLQQQYGGRWNAVPSDHETDTSSCACSLCCGRGRWAQDSASYSSAEHEEDSTTEAAQGALLGTEPLDDWMHRWGAGPTPGPERDALPCRLGASAPTNRALSMVDTDSDMELIAQEVVERVATTACSAMTPERIAFSKALGNA